VECCFLKLESLKVRVALVSFPDWILDLKRATRPAANPLESTLVRGVRLVLGDNGVEAGLGFSECVVLLEWCRA
jgi:hypothetical protein